MKNCLICNHRPATFSMKSIFLLTFLFSIPTGFLKLSAQPDTVKAGAYIISVHDINFRDKEYTIRFWLWFLYDNPSFNFSRQIDIPNAKSIEQPDIIIDELEGRSWAMMKMKCVMKENWMVHDFPFDQQHLKVKIENSIYDVNSLVFEPDVKGSVFGDDETIDGWGISNFKVSTTQNEYQTGFGDSRPGRDKQNFSQFIIEMDIERDAFGLFMKIFLGMYIAFLISMLSFTPHPSELEPRFGLPVGGLFAAVGNKYIIDFLLPETSSFTLVDTLHTLTFMAIFMTLVVSALSLKLYDRGKSEESVRFSRRGSRVVVSAYVLLNVIFIFLAIF